MSHATAIRTNGDREDGHFPWPASSGQVSRTDLGSLAIPIHTQVVTFLLGDLIGRKLRVASGPVTVDREPGRVTILTDAAGRITDMWVDPDDHDDGQA
ncbi:hypothetical protein [Bordetella bronchialis]|uniref:Uncharacterized protein n=1 Tax=Bordetella bronchialis TaxID=463025 RepID=A0A193FLM9_9BORD|nr:hypothetical protein [Bordetella bronchialis]ANN68153.1 hypothetical protein BAU06_19265 [Bordetella bronchialis]ANN73286.1 hypothetical protein BAU08_19765 [Bordetella bronchialis]